MIFGLVIAILAVLAGIVLFAKNAPSELPQPANWVKTLPVGVKPPEDRSGWVYFAGGEDTPIKVGMSQYEPTSHRLAELKSMSPVPLKLYYSQWYPDRYAAEAEVHTALQGSRLHGEWFDRDVALYYAAHLRGEL